MFKQLPVNEISVGQRQRSALDENNLRELCESINRSGLINPITVTEAGELVAGHHRLEAHKRLGIPKISVQILEQLSDLDRQLIELEENVIRAELPWQDRVKAVQHFHTLLAESEENWTAEKSAERLGVKPSTVSRYIMVAEELQNGNERVNAAPTVTTAINLAERKRERERDSAVESSVDMIFNPVSSADEAEGLPTPLPPVQVNSPEPPTEPDPAPFRLQSFIDFVDEYEGPKFNLVHCDFPYGVNAQNEQQGTANLRHEAYDDRENIYWELLDALHTSMADVVAQSAHLIFWFSMDFYTETKSKLENMGWKVQPHPLIWHKNDNVGLLPDPKRGPRRIYETAFIASRGDRKIVAAKSNAFAAPGRNKEYHRDEKPVAMLTHFMEMLTDGSTRFIDPTCGSGNSVIAAQRLGASSYLGLEKEPKIFDETLRNWKQNGKDGNSN